MNRDAINADDIIQFVGQLPDIYLGARHEDDDSVTYFVGWVYFTDDKNAPLGEYRSEELQSFEDPAKAFKFWKTAMQKLKDTGSPI